jgi:hypothetical protein
VSAFVLVGAFFAIVGIALLGTAIRHQHRRQPRYAAMLIGGMMATAFGIVIAGFAIAYDAASPLDLDTGPAK